MVKERGCEACDNQQVGDNVCSDSSVHSAHVECVAFAHGCPWLVFAVPGSVAAMPCEKQAHHKPFVRPPSFFCAGV
eukprot:1967494-Alexandrium_andersonii.AAC.2